MSICYDLFEGFFCFFLHFYLCIYSYTVHISCTVKYVESVCDTEIPIRENELHHNLDFLKYYVYAL